MITHLRGMILIGSSLLQIPLEGIQWSQWTDQANQSIMLLNHCPLGDEGNSLALLVNCCQGHAIERI